MTEKVEERMENRGLLLRLVTCVSTVASDFVSGLQLLVSGLFSGQKCYSTCKSVLFESVSP